MKITNMKSPRGNVVPNQFEIETTKGTLLQSYATIVAYKGKTALVSEDWDCSKTTAKYTAQFLGYDSAKELRQAIKYGRVSTTRAIELGGN